MNVTVVRKRSAVKPFLVFALSFGETGKTCNAEKRIPAVVGVENQ